MIDLVASTEAIRGYSEHSAAVATGVAGAAAVDQSATLAAARPIFGTIGAEFVSAFATAQANHFASLGDLAEVHRATAATLRQTAANYEASDHASATGFGPNGGPR